MNNLPPGCTDRDIDRDTATDRWAEYERQLQRGDEMLDRDRSEPRNAHVAEPLAAVLNTFGACSVGE